VADAARLVTAGVVGRPHGLDGSFHVERPMQPLRAGTVVRVAEAQRRVERSDGTEQRPLIRLDGVATREAVASLRGELLLVEDRLADDEWLAEDLVGCRVEGLGTVLRVIDSPSCHLLELEGGELVPLIADAVERVDVERRTIEVDRRFLRLEEGQRG
jgi:16S rRNA processing protein RimM